MTAFAFSHSSDWLLVWGANVLLQVTLVTAVALVITALARRNPAARHWVLASGLLLALLCPVIALVTQLSGSSLLSVSLMHEAPAPAPDATVQEAPEETLPVEPSSYPLPLEDFRATRNPVGGLTDYPPQEDARHVRPDPTNTATSVSPPPDSTAPSEEAITAPAITQPGATWVGKILRTVMRPLLIVWFAGAAFLLARLAVGWVRFAAILRRARPNDNAELAESFEQVGRTLQVTRMPELLLSDRAPGPYSAGLLRGRVVFPRRMVDRVTGAQLRDILIHEVAHVVRRDQVVVLLQNLAAAIFWLHPLARVLNRRLAQAREEVCDNWVLAATDAPSYSRTLLRLVELVDTTRSLPEALGLFTSCWKLERRVAGLLDERRSRGIRLTAGAKTVGVALSLVMAMVVALGTITLAVGQAETNDATALGEGPALGEGLPTSPKRTTEGLPSTGRPSVNHHGGVGRPAPSETEGTTVIRGTILGPDGKPAARAFVSVLANKFAGNMHVARETLAEAVADDAGRYELSLQGAFWKTHKHPQLVARTDQSAIAWRPLDLDVQQTTLDISLQPQQLIQVRLVDIKGRPAAVTLSSIWVVGPAYDRDQILNLPGLAATPKAGLAPTKTDDRGLLTIPNIAAGHGVCMSIPGDERFAPQVLALNTGKPEERGENDGTFRSQVVKNMEPGEVATITLAPAKTFEGVVLLGDTDKPAANARITIWSSQRDPPLGVCPMEDKTDEAGRFRLNPKPGVCFGIEAYPPEGAPYHSRRLDVLHWTSGAESKNIEIRLAPGVLAHGTIVDAQTGRPLRGASVQYIPRENNTNLPDDILTGWQGIQKTDDAGKFAITVAPGPGTLLVHAEQPGYILEEVGSRELDRGEPGGTRMYAHAFEELDPAVDKPLEALNIALTPGTSVKGTLTDADGKRIKHALVISRLKIPPYSPQWRGFSDEARNGKFEISGLRDGEEYSVSFLDPENRLGATALISTSYPSPTIVLKPCGSVTARFVDPDGKPSGVGRRFGLHMVITPGRWKYDRDPSRRGELLADEDFISNVDRINNDPPRTTDAQGRMTILALIPGACYRFINFNRDGPDISSTFIAKSGETHDMGDIEVDLD